MYISDRVYIDLCPCLKLRYIIVTQVVVCLYLSVFHSKCISPIHIRQLSSFPSHPWAETWRRIWGTKTFFRGPISGKISDDLFFSHRPGSSDFSFLFPHFPYVYYVKCRI